MNYQDFASQERMRRIYGRAHKSMGVAVLLWLFCWPALLWWMFGAAWGILPFVGVICLIIANAKLGMVALVAVAIGSLVAALWAIGNARAEEQRMMAAQ